MPTIVESRYLYLGYCLLHPKLVIFVRHLEMKRTSERLGRLGSRAHKQISWELRGSSYPTYFRS